MLGFLAGAISTVQAQEKIIEPNLGFVNEIIKADTILGGKQAHTVYVFRRNSTYLVNGSIQNIGYPITLKAEAGTGRIPLISNWPDANGTLNRIVDANDNAYIYNLYIDGMGPNLTTGEPDPFYKMNGQLLRAAAAGKELIIDGCVLNNVGQVIIRSNSGARKVMVTNTTFANGGQLSSDNVGNGRIIDVRNGVTDTVIFRNCTMVNTLDRIFRHYNASTNSATNFIKYIELDHNTIVHNTGAFGFLMLGDIEQGCKITNNLFVNPMSFGADTSDKARFGEVQVFGEFDGNGVPILPLIMDQPNTSSNPTFTISNNVVSYQPEVKKFFTDNGLTGAQVITARLAAKVGANPYSEADVTLKKIPNVMMNVMTWYHDMSKTANGGGMITHASLDMDRRSAIFWTDSLNCAYTSGNAAFKGSDGKPVGSNVWSSVLTDVTEESALPTEFSLSNNYPNPFNPTTNIQFSLPENGAVSLAVYNLIGQEVTRIVEQRYSAGTHSVTFNASRLSSGVYIYKLNVIGENGHNFSASHKMTLLK